MYGLPVMGGNIEEFDAWSVLPADRVVRLAPAESLLVTLDPLPDDAPLVLPCHLTAADTVPDVVDAVLDRLEHVARGLFPAWLPGAEDIAGSGEVELRAVESLALSLASRSEHFGPFLTDLARSAVAGIRPQLGRFARRTRVEGLIRVLAASYGRQGVALLVTTAPNIDRYRQQVVAEACEWLCAYGPVAVWMSMDALPEVDRFPIVELPSFEAGDRVVAALPTDTCVHYPPLEGRPHPGSSAERKLEDALRECDWAYGRCWNTTYRSSALRPPIRVDLMWRSERCVVEVDGPDHRARTKYATDRTRDVHLQLDGYAVLRFTNEQVLDDVATVVGSIEKYLSDRRRSRDIATPSTVKGPAQ